MADSARDPLARPERDLRERVANSIEELQQPGGLLDSATFGTDKAGVRADGVRSPSERRRRHEVVNWYLGLASDVDSGGLAAAITTGPPGAGKSTVMEREGLSRRGWRTLDADLVKDELLRRAIAEGTFSRQLSIVLPDGQPVMPRELAGLVHNESTSILQTIQTDCLLRGENIVIEGTLGWAGQGSALLDDLYFHGYRSVTIFSVEVTQAVSYERALYRWWSGRTAAIGTTNSTDSLGGRFTPRSAIATKWPGKSRRSLCSIHAVETYNSPRARDFSETILVRDNQSTGMRHRFIRRRLPDGSIAETRT